MKLLMNLIINEKDKDGNYPFLKCIKKILIKWWLDFTGR